MDSYKAESEMLKGKWATCVWPAGASADHTPSTGISKQVLIDVATKSVTLPESFVSCVSISLKRQD